jgi:divalent metal cation (Fe/Co/Zn/Cd) transporter
MVIEAAVGITIGWLAWSIALLTFGLDSVIELVAGSVLLYRLRAEARGIGEATTEALERQALQVVGVTFLLLAAYALYESAMIILGPELPIPSRGGVALAVAALVAMPLLGLAKRRVGLALGSHALVADAKESFACAYLSCTLLLGLGLNALFGWWWADPVAALVMVPFLIREGWEAIAEAREHS